MLFDPVDTQLLSLTYLQSNQIHTKFCPRHLLVSHCVMSGESGENSRVPKTTVTLNCLFNQITHIGYSV